MWDGGWGPHKACLTSSPPPEEYPLIAGNNVVFSSYPGTIFSGDDFYILGSGLVSGRVTCSLGTQHTGSGDTVKDEVCRASELLVLGTFARPLSAMTLVCFCVQHKHLLSASDLALHCLPLSPPPNLATF